MDRPQTDITSALFLETTVQCDRTTMNGLRLTAIEERLGTARLLCSTYVLGEFKSTFIRDAVTFHQLLVESGSVQEAANRFEAYRGRPRNRMNRLFVKLSETADRLDRLAALAAIEAMIEWQLESRFMAGLSLPLLNETACEKATAAVRRNGESYTIDVHCTKDRPRRCRIAAFIMAHRTQIETIQSGLAEDKAEFQDFTTTLKSILDGGSPHGKACAVVSDLLIALEVPEGATLATTNTKHFQPISRVLGHPPLCDPIPRRAPPVPPQSDEPQL